MLLSCCSLVVHKICIKSCTSCKSHIENLHSATARDQIYHWHLMLCFCFCSSTKSDQWLGYSLETGWVMQDLALLSTNRMRVTLLRHQRYQEGNFVRKKNKLCLILSVKEKEYTTSHKHWQLFYLFVL